MKYKALPGILFLFSITAVFISAQNTPRIPVIKTGVLHNKSISPLPAPVLTPSIDPGDVAGSEAVNVEALIDMNGKVISAKAVSGHPLLRRAAEEAALKTRFRPTLADGPGTIRVLGTLVYDLASFRLRPGEKKNDTTLRFISHGLSKPTPLLLPKPAYPPGAAAVNVSGPVSVSITIGKTGNVISAKVLSGHPLLRHASRAAAKRARFRPVTLSGAPVNAYGIIVYNYVIE